MKNILGALLFVTVVAGPASAQEQPWRWRKAVPAGQTVEIRNVTGSIRATAAAGSEVEIVATRSGRDADIVEIVAEEHSGGVVVCAIYDGRSGCDDESRRGNRHRDTDAEVDFEVRIPKGVKFTGRSVTGDVEATGLDARVKAGTVSGNVRVSTSDIANASSVSGSLRVRMGRADWSGNLAFSTVSGDIDIEFTGDLNADVEMSTVSGDIESDWPITLTAGRRRSLSGRIGSGGRELSFSTVSGSVEIRRAN